MLRLSPRAGQGWAWLRLASLDLAVLWSLVRILRSPFSRSLSLHLFPFHIPAIAFVASHFVDLVIVLGDCVTGAARGGLGGAFAGAAKTLCGSEEWRRRKREEDLK